MLNNSFCEMAVKSKTSVGYYVKMFFSIVVILAGVLLFPIIGAISLVIVVIGVCMIGYFAQEKNVEYEYTFTDGSVDIAVVYGGSKRKEVFSFDMDQVSMIVPLGSKRIEHERFTQKRDYSSKKRSDKIYCFVLESDKEKKLVMLEPNERALAQIKMYGRNKMYND